MIKLKIPVTTIGDHDWRESTSDTLHHTAYTTACRHRIETGSHRSLDRTMIFPFPNIIHQFTRYRHFRLGVLTQGNPDRITDTEGKLADDTDIVDAGAAYGSALQLYRLKDGNRVDQTSS